jgi:hypothetical protein
MGFKCKKCKEAVKEKANKLVTQIRNVTYNNPCKNILDYNNSDRISTGKEIVEEITCCMKCFKEHKDKEPKVIGKDKQVFVKAKIIDKKDKIRKQSNHRRRDDEDFDGEVPEKYAYES